MLEMMPKLVHPFSTEDVRSISVTGASYLNIVFFSSKYYAVPTVLELYTVLYTILLSTKLKRIFFISIATLFKYIKSFSSFLAIILIFFDNFLIRILKK